MGGNIIYELIEQWVVSDQIVDIKGKKKIEKGNFQITNYPVGFFDGATQGGRCGSGFCLKLSEEQEFWIHWYGGEGTSMKAKVVAIWGLLWFIKFLDILQVQIFGDSKCLIDHVNGKNNIQQVSLQGWLRRIKSIWITFQNPSIEHINKPHNKIVDDLSKK